LIPTCINLLAIHIEPVGSRITCNPAPTDTDEDFLVLLPDNREASNALIALIDDNWRLDGSLVTDEVNRNELCSRFQSYSKDETNLIITRSPVFYRRFIAATKIATLFNLLDKKDRIALFQGVLYGNYPE
jgi:hypothetical protein